MLLSRPKIKLDESIESFLIRLSYENGYATKQLINLYYQNKNENARCSPNLCSININHAAVSSKSRLNFFKELSVISNNTQDDILESLIYRSDKIFSRSSTVLLCRSIEIPAVLFSNYTVPICPLCLSEQRYIRQVWHIKPYLLCHEHKIPLISNCPSCGKSLSYIMDQSILHCSCGCSLSDLDISTSNSNDFLLSLSRMIYNSLLGEKPNALFEKEGFPTTNIHSIFGMIVFFDRFIKVPNKKNESTTKMSDNFIKFVIDWPQSFYEYLDMLLLRKFKYLLKPASKSGFSSIFGELLHEIQNIPDNTFQNNHILRETFYYLQKEIEQERDTKKRDKLSDLLLTKQEAALLLGTDTAQIAYLTAEGYLTAKQKRLEAYIPNYPLGEVFNLWAKIFSKQK